ncbi:putative flavonol reductase [Mycena sp. CBHHK59/15]|nr:putative flavonol reductase [Mycena sp. CBHHK59/15]
MLDPAIEGTLNVLRSAHKAGIKRVIITSSLAALLDPSKNGAWRDHMFTPADWNPATYEEASDGTRPGIWVYLASKKLAETAAFEYTAQHPEMQITTMNPPMIFGPPLQAVSTPEALNTSSQAIYQLISGQTKEIPLDGLPLFVDVRDVATAHILALKNDAMIGKRVLLSGGPYTSYDTVKIIAERRPELAARLPSLELVANPKGMPIAKVDTSIAEKGLGMSFMSYEKCLFDTIDSLLEMEKMKWKL